MRKLRSAFDLLICAAFTVAYVGAGVVLPLVWRIMGGAPRRTAV